MPDHGDNCDAEQHMNPWPTGWRVYVRPDPYHDEHRGKSEIHNGSLSCELTCGECDGPGLYWQLLAYLEIGTDRCDVRGLTYQDPHLIARARLLAVLLTRFLASFRKPTTSCIHHGPAPSFGRRSIMMVAGRNAEATIRSPSTRRRGRSWILARISGNEPRLDTIDSTAASRQVLASASSTSTLYG